MKNANLLFIQKVLTDTTLLQYNSILPYLTITSIMMLLHDNHIQFTDIFSTLFLDKQGLFNSVNVADIRKISNAIYSFAYVGDYESANILNPLLNIPEHYAALSNKLNAYDMLTLKWELKNNYSLSSFDIPDFASSERISSFHISLLTLKDDFIDFISSNYKDISNGIINGLDKSIKKGLLNHPLFICEPNDGTYEIYILTHNIPNQMTSDDFTLIGFDKNAMIDNITYSKNNSTTRYISNFFYKIPICYFEQSTPYDINSDVHDYLPKMIEHYSKVDNVCITPRLLYLNKNNMNIPFNRTFSLEYEPMSKELLYTYKHIYNEIGLMPNKVGLTNNNYIEVYKNNWLHK